MLRYNCNKDFIPQDLNKWDFFLTVSHWFRHIIWAPKPVYRRRKPSVYGSGFLICTSTLSIKSTQHDIIRKFYKLEQSVMCRLHLLITVSFSFKLFSKACLYIVVGGHSVITLSQNDQNLDPPSPLFALFELWFYNFITTYCN